jgi:hypothetical protein
VAGGVGVGVGGRDDNSLAIFDFALVWLLPRVRTRVCRETALVRRLELALCAREWLLPVVHTRVSRHVALVTRAVIALIAQERFWLAIVSGSAAVG